jgi:hypothetical protein
VQSGRPGRNRTCNPRIRNPMLYPFELRAHNELRRNLRVCGCMLSVAFARLRSQRFASACRYSTKRSRPNRGRGCATAGDSARIKARKHWFKTDADQFRQAPSFFPAAYFRRENQKAVERRYSGCSDERDGSCDTHARTADPGEASRPCEYANESPRS